MGKEKKVSIRKTRTVITYAELWHASWSLLKNGKDREEGSHYQFMGSLVFSAFTFEAYLNDIGPKSFSEQNWNALERLSPKKKLEVIAEQLGCPVDYGRRPWSIMKKLFEFRNDIAHGKSDPITETQVVSLDDHEKHLWEFAKPEWEKFVTGGNAERAREDVEQMVKALHEKRGVKGETPFIGGFQDSDISLLD
ncbi:hypothetical protein [Paludisphaera borealis]|uniref:RiboL-PSP-HEPN domain-containing protein n=1 Tax=Paludisphaera borealis TaxID=1387353 RepID=A0A1U7CS90_9BACT|nr:hypothetical protein [Paludisphaera borealis]APW61820.1 hypothetical protein BSF38_03349 [Paludisphaera borealis]